MRIGSLFSGYGGLDEAVRQALGGGHVVWHSDIKPAAVQLLAHRHPGVPNLGDLTAVWPASRALPAAAVAPIEVLAASWPCQPHSSAGKHLGAFDPRALWPNVARALAELRPALFFGENVAPIIRTGELRRVSQSLAALGYLGAYRMQRASDVNGCHQRGRCFIVAVDPAHPDAARLALPTPAPPLSRGADRRLTLLPTPTRSMTTGPWSEGREGGLNLQTAIDRLDGPLHTSPYAAAVRQWESAFGQPAPAPTQPRTGGPDVLAPVFVEWMMGLPAGWVTEVPGLGTNRAGARNAMLSLLGDGVMPQQGAAAFRFLLNRLHPRVLAAA